MKKLLPVIFILLSGCAVSQISALGEIGNENRPDSSNRQVASVGVEVETKNGVSVSTRYVNNVVDFDFSDNDEHGVFVGVKVPIWKNKN